MTLLREAPVPRLARLPIAVFVFLLAVAVALPVSAQPPRKSPTMAQFLSPGYPASLVSAKKADRLAWTVLDAGKRNVYTAAGPDYKPVRLTSFLDDNGIDTSDPAISDDGSVVIFVRGHSLNRAGYGANPTSHLPSRFSSRARLVKLHHADFTIRQGRIDISSGPDQRIHYTLIGAVAHPEPQHSWRTSQQRRQRRIIVVLGDDDIAARSGEFPYLPVRGLLQPYKRYLGRPRKGFPQQRHDAPGQVLVQEQFHAAFTQAACLSRSAAKARQASRSSRVNSG